MPNTECIEYRSFDKGSIGYPRFWCKKSSKHIQCKEWDHCMWDNWLNYWWLDRSNKDSMSWLWILHYMSDRSLNRYMWRIQAWEFHTIRMSPKMSGNNCLKRKVCMLKLRNIMRSWGGELNMEYKEWLLYLWSKERNRYCIRCMFDWLSIERIVNQILNKDGRENHWYSGSISLKCIKSR